MPFASSFRIEVIQWLSYVFPDILHADAMPFHWFRYFSKYFYWKLKLNSHKKIINILRIFQPNLVIFWVYAAVLLVCFLSTLLQTYLVSTEKGFGIHFTIFTFFLHFFSWSKRNTFFLYLNWLLLNVGWINCMLFFFVPLILQIIIFIKIKVFPVVNTMTYAFRGPIQGILPWYYFPMGLLFPFLGQALAQINGTYNQDFFPSKSPFAISSLRFSAIYTLAKGVVAVLEGTVLDFDNFANSVVFMIFLTLILIFLSIYHIYTQVFIYILLKSFLTKKNKIII